MTSFSLTSKNVSLHSPITSLVPIAPAWECIRELNPSNSYQLLK